MLLLCLNFISILCFEIITNVIIETCSCSNHVPDTGLDMRAASADVYGTELNKITQKKSTGFHGQTVNISESCARREEKLLLFSPLLEKETTGDNLRGGVSVSPGQVVRSDSC